MWVMSHIPLVSNLDFLNPMDMMFKDFDMTDIVFSKIREEPNADDDIILVNLSNPYNVGRSEFTMMLNIIQKQQPKVVGVDAFYRSQQDPEIDSMLAEACKKTDNLVMVSKLSKPNEKKHHYDSLEKSNPMFIEKVHTGFANLITSGKGTNMQELVTVRAFSPQEKVIDGKEEKMEPSFGVKIAQLYDSEATKLFLKRKNKLEYINFRGNAGPKTDGKFFALDYFNILNEEFDPELMKGKIVLLGYMGETLDTPSFEDKFYTPLNENYVGRATLDMYGVVVHANIISMILQQDYINTMNPWLNGLLAFLITMLSTILFSYFYKYMGFWYDAVTIIFQLLFSLLLLTIVIYAFHWYRLKIDTGLALVGVIFSGIFVEIYFGLVNKLFLKVRKRKLKSLDK